MSHIHLIKQSKLLIIFGCVFYLAFLAECGLAGLIKYIAKGHAYMYGKSNIQEYANSNLHQLIEELFFAKYSRRQI